MGRALGEAEIASVVREVTDEEVAFYQDHGWVKLDHLITPEFAGDLLQAGRDWRARHTEPPVLLSVHPDPEPFRSVMFSEVMGRNASRLANRARLSGADIPIRYHADSFIERTPGGAKGTTYHQDSVEHGSDRVGEIRFWLALAEITPEMGAMRFVDKSHREGPLGSVFNEDGGGDLLDLYPKLTEVLGLTEPFHYQPGDCTVHHGYLVHGSPPNAGDRPRLSYIFSYLPADSRWRNGKVGNWGSQRVTLGDEANPVVYPKQRVPA